jgi:hypothetical protein
MDIQITDEGISCGGQLLTCGQCEQPLSPSAASDGSFLFLGEDADGPSVLLLQCPLCPAEEGEHGA